MRERARLAVALAFTLPGCVAPGDVASVSAPVVYDADGRQEVYESADPIAVAIARDAAVAFVPDVSGYLVPQGDGTYVPDPYSLAEAVEDMGADSTDDGLPTLPFCPDERFGEQPTVAFCSGTLIAEDLVLTAGHCTTEGACPASTRLVFDYHYRAPGELETIDEADLYRCAEVVAYADDGTDGRDFAILRLDRPVEGREPAVVDPRFAITVGEPVSAIGFPTGIPAKIDQSGQVKTGSNGVYFEASTDTFVGSSGSGIFDADGELIGILVRGAIDYVAKGDCLGVNNVSTAGLAHFEDATLAAVAMKALCQSEPDDVLCELGPAPSSESKGCVAGSGGSTWGALGVLAALFVGRRNKKRPRP